MKFLAHFLLNACILLIVTFSHPVLGVDSNNPPDNSTPITCPAGQRPTNTGDCVPIVSDNTIIGISAEDLRSGNVNMDTIPQALAYVINFLIAIAGTISIVMLIYFAVKMQLASGITGDTSGIDKAKKGMIASLIGFIIAISAWFIMARVVDLLTTMVQ